MERIARWNQASRNDLIEETAARKHMNPAVVEMDFWVCWTLKRIFSNPELANKLMFKGGTTLSKIFNLIERFSEDIDLILRMDEITDEDAVAKRTKSGRDKFRKKVDKGAEQYIRNTLMPEIQTLLGDICTVELVEPDDDVLPKIKVNFPSAYQHDYLRPDILLEIGPLAAWTPNEVYRISPYIAEEFSHRLNEMDCEVRAITAERTFWEKATILHFEANRPEDRPQPFRYSRHYYDLACMAEKGVKTKALADLPLLAAVVDFKEMCYPCSWADFKSAVPGSFKLLPSAYWERALRRDYRDMQVMIYGKVPKFDEIIESLAVLESEINDLRQQDSNL